MAKIELTDIEKQDIENVANLPYVWKKLKNSTLLVSGGTGFIGTFLLNVFSYRNHVFGDNIKAVVISRKGGSNNEYVKHIQQDVTKVFEVNESIDYVLHLASNTHPKQYKSEPIETITTNIFGCNNLLKIAHAKKARFLLASSVEVYGEGNGSPMDESYSGFIDFNTARAGYNESKRVCESLCQAYRKQYGIDTVVARLSRVFGADRKEDSKAIAQFFNSAIKGENIILNSAGLQRFSYCYVADAVSGILKVLLDGESGEAYNIAAEDDAMTLRDYADKISKLAGTDVIINIKMQEETSKAQYAILDSSKLKKLGWSPSYSVISGIQRTYKIMKERTLDE